MIDSTINHQPASDRTYYACTCGNTYSSRNARDIHIIETHPDRDIPQKVWESDSFLDFVIDELTEAAGYKRGFTSPLNLARWDLKGALRVGLNRHHNREG